MKIGKSTVPRTAICTSDEHTIVVRGQDLCRDLIGKLSFADYFFLLLTGKQPDAACSTVLNATLVAIAEHGLVPSVQASRMTFAAAPDALQGAVAAGILGCGSVILGASETAGRLVMDVAAREDAGATLPDAATVAITELKAARAAIPAVLLGVGFPVASLRGVPILARTAGLIAHLAEEAEAPSGFALSYQATRELQYEGELPAGFGAST